MSKSVKYFVYGAQSSFVEFDLDYSAAGVSLRGSEVIYTGGSGVETVFVSSGVSFDFTNASGKVDRLYLSAPIGDYSFLKQGTNLLLTETTSGSVVKVLAGSSLSFDQVVFADGMASSKALYDAAGTGSVPVLDAQIKTPGNKSDLYSALGVLPDTSVKAFAATNEGVTFATVPKGGATLIATGGSGVDIVYVASGSKVDAVDLSGGTDRIYLTGSFLDYERSYQGTTLVLSRTDGVSSEIVKVNGGSLFAFDRIIFADGAARSWDLYNAAKNNASLPALDPSLTTPGLAPSLKPSALENIVDLDVRSNVVLQFTEDVLPQAGKFIRIINEPNSNEKAGLYGESIENSLILDVSDPRVQVLGGRVTIDPERDLDFSNNYRIEVDAGAFVGRVTGQPNSVVGDATALRFSTVTPGVDRTVTSIEGTSRIMLSDGTLGDGLVWKDIEGWLNGKTGPQTDVDLGARNIGLVTADMLPDVTFLDNSGLGGSLTNIETGDFHLKLVNFGAGDLIYMDDLGRNDENPDEPLQMIFGPQFSADPNGRFNFDAASGKAGGVIEIEGQSFSTLMEWQQLLGANQSPFVYGSTGVSAPIQDIMSPSIKSAIISTDGRTVTLTFDEPLDTAVAASQIVGQLAIQVGTSSAVTIDTVSISGSTVTLTLPASATPIPSAASLGANAVTVSYTDPTTGNDTAGVLQDGSGNDVATFTAFQAQNDSTYTPGGGTGTGAPTLTISSYPGDKILANGYASLTFTFSEPVTGFDLSDVVVTGGKVTYLEGSTSNPGVYYAGFEPFTDFDGTATFAVNAGAAADVDNNPSTAASLSVPTFTVQPVNSGVAYFTMPSTGHSDLVIGFSEAIAPYDAGVTSLYGIYLTRNPDPTNPYGSSSGPGPNVTGYSLSADGTVLTLHTDTNFLSSDVVRVSIQGNTIFVDSHGNGLASQDIYIGGDEANTIDLQYYGSMSRQILRGNLGDDQLFGTYSADTLVDGGGADVMVGLGGGDAFYLVETGASGSPPLAYARDAVVIGLGDSLRGLGSTDAVFGDATNANSGFDWFSPSPSNHDALYLESGLIGDASSFVATPTQKGVLAGHSIADGIVTFRDSANNPVDIRQDSDLGDALDYLRFNLQAPGHTVAFKADYNNNDALESLFVYQDMGTLPLLGNVEMPDIVVRVEQPATTAATRLASVTLGNAPGANVLEIRDGFSPDPWALDLTSTGVTFNFVEPVFGPSGGPSALAVSLQVNGTGPVYRPTSLTGEGSTELTVHSAGLNLASTDWALITYGGTNVGNALRDAAGNAMAPEGQDGPTEQILVLGSSGANIIDLSARTVSGWGVNVQAGAGDDSVIGTSAPDRIVAGRGADTLAGGGGGDDFEFEQGDSPVVTVSLAGGTANTYPLAGATYTFAGGNPEVITDFGAGDAVYLNPYLEGLTGSRWLHSTYSSVGGIDGNVPNGLPDDQAFKVLQGDLGTDGVFTVGMNDGDGADLLVLYDGDGSANVSPTAFVLQGVTMNDIEGLYSGGNAIRSNKPVDTGGGGTVGNTYIDWSQDHSGLIRIAGDDELEFTVHFSDPVSIDTSKGSPQLSISFVDDSGVRHSASAAFIPYGLPDAAGSYVQDSMRFALGLLSTDVGRYHVEAFLANGANIVSLADNLAVDLTLDDSNRPFTASAYVYSAPLASMTGTAGNDLIAGYLANPSAVPADGNYAGVTGGDGNRDVLAVPILLPGTLTGEQANGYVLNFDRTNMVMQAFAPGSTTAAVTMKVPSTFPSGVERLAYFTMFQTAGTGGTPAYEFTDGSPVILSSAVITYQDPVDEGDAFVFGSFNADTITLPEIAGGRQAVRAGPGGDSIIGSSGVDVINGDGGNDTIRAGGGDDFIFLSGGTDSVDGGGGQDTVVATLPGQMMNIGGRISGFALQSLTGQWTTTGFEATSTSNVYRILADDSGALTVKNFSDGTTAMWASNVEAIEVRQAQSDIRTTVPLIQGSADALPDALVGTGSSIVNGRAGDDTLTASSLGNDVLLGGSGNDTLNGGAARDLLYGGPGDDALYGGGGNDWFVGEGGNDTLVGGDGNDAAGFLVANASATPLSFAWDSTADGVLIKQGTLALAKISAGANGVWLVQDLANPSTGFGTDTVSGVENLTFDFGSGSTATTGLTIPSIQIDELLFAPSPWSSVVTGLAAAGYTAAIPATGLTPDPGNLGVTALAPQVNTVAGTTNLRYDITLDPTTFSDVDPMLMLIQFGGGPTGVLSASAISPTWVDSGGQARPMWLLDTSALASSGQVWATANGVSDPALYQANPLIEPGTGRVATVELTVSGNVSSAPVLSVAGVEVYTADWLDAMLAAQPPLLVAQVNEVSQVQISGLSDDNLLRYAAIYDQTTGETHVAAMFDTNPALNQVEPSALIDLSFLGDVRASLVPESLTFSG